MAIRVPNKIFGWTNTRVTAGTDTYDFLLPQDCSGFTVQVYTGTFSGTNETADIYVQTSPDGGSTWYDMGHFPQIVAAVTKNGSMFAHFSTTRPEISGLSGSAIGAGTTSALAAGEYSGVPILGRNTRILYTQAGTQMANAGTVINVFADQDATA